MIIIITALTHETGGTAGFVTSEIFVIIMHIKKLKWKKNERKESR